MNRKSSPQILITTSDYLPQLGGLTSYTLNIEAVLKSLQLNYDLFHWPNIKALKQFTPSKKYDYIIHIHQLGSYYLQHLPAKHIGIYHGSELFFTSANLLKKVIKKLLAPAMIHSLEQNYLNIFISTFTRELAQSQGLKLNYARDIIFHNCIDIADATFYPYPIENKIKLCAIVRNTPHKNVAGCIELATHLQNISGLPVELTLPFKYTQSTAIKLNAIEQMSDKQREQVYQASHFNLLLSLDHSHRGFIEGFGLSCLEAGKYGTPSIVFNTGGLPDNIHPEINGFLISNTKVETITKLWQQLQKFDYQQLRHNTFDHTTNSHGLDQYEKLFRQVLV